MDSSGTLFRMAILVYQAQQHYHTKRLNLPRGYRLIAVLESPYFEKMGYVAASSSKIVIAFRGTGEWSDWKTDLNAAQTGYPFLRKGGKTHKGFTELYTSLRPGILDALKRCGSNKKILSLAGHSLGGALASLCALDPAVKKTCPVIKLYTYGAPKVGDPAFAAALQKRTQISIRVHKAGDWVPSMPPSNLLGMEYAHAERSFAIPTGIPLTSHSIVSYAAALSRQAAQDARRLCSRNPECCPPGLFLQK